MLIKITMLYLEQLWLWNFVLSFCINKNSTLNQRNWRWAINCLLHESQGTCKQCVGKMHAISAKSDDTHSNHWTLKRGDNEAFTMGRCATKTYSKRGLQLLSSSIHSPQFYGRGTSIAFFWQHPANGSHSEPVKSSPFSVYYLSTIRVNIILTSSP
jgi:hypothetical protein